MGRVPAAGIPTEEMARFYTHAGFMKEADQSYRLPQKETDLNERTSFNTGIRTFLLQGSIFTNTGLHEEHSSGK